MAGRAALRAVGTLISRPGAVQLRGYAKKPGPIESSMQLNSDLKKFYQNQKCSDLLESLSDWTQENQGQSHKTQIAKGKGKGFVKEVQKGPEVCKDPALLTTHAMGVNIYKSGSDVKLKDDSQYPEWLFQLDLEPPKPLEERSPDTPQYWKLLRKLHMWRNNRLAKAKKF